MQPPSLGDAQIVLCPPRENDLGALVEACNDPLIVRFTRVPAPYGPEDARAFLANAAEGLANGTHYSLVIAEATTDELLGTILLGLQGNAVAEIGYWVRKEARG